MGYQRDWGEVGKCARDQTALGGLFCGESNLWQMGLRFFFCSFIGIGRGDFMLLGQVSFWDDRVCDGPKVCDYEGSLGGDAGLEGLLCVYAPIGTSERVFFFEELIHFINQ